MNTDMADNSDSRNPRANVSPLLSIDDVTMRYEARTVLRNISFDVHAGEVLALIGPNGVGKSTLLRACSGTLKPIDGRVLIDGRDALRLRVDERAKLIAVVPQAVRLPEIFNVFETVLARPRKRDGSISGASCARADGHARAGSTAHR
jgi:ABC-type cobalamin/Fe3+-siderophores transport system ATPase subunit